MGPARTKVDWKDEEGGLLMWAAACGGGWLYRF